MIASGINQKGGQRGDNFTLHDLRRVYATELVHRGVNPKTIQHLFGHSGMDITDIYIGENFEDMAAAGRLLDEPAEQVSEGVH